MCFKFVKKNVAIGWLADVFFLALLFFFWIGRVEFNPRLIHAFIAIVDERVPPFNVRHFLIVASALHQFNFSSQQFGIDPH